MRENEDGQHGDGGERHSFDESLSEEYRYVVLRYGEEFAKILFSLPTYLLFPIRVLIFLALILTVIGLVLLFISPLVVAELWRDINMAAASFIWIRILFLCVLFLTGILFYLARQFIRRAYGAVEVGIGAALCWVPLGNPAIDNFSRALAIASGIYVIVRGLDNYVQGQPLFHLTRQWLAKGHWQWLIRSIELNPWLTQIILRFREQSQKRGDPRSG